MNPLEIDQDRIDTLKKLQTDAAEIEEAKEQNFDHVFYSIGYAKLKTIDELIEIMQSYGVRMLVDVRSKPNTRRFSKKDLAKRPEIVYFSREDMGGLGYEPNEYEEWLEGALVGINQLITSGKNGNKVMIMCQEHNPDQCHRKYFVGRTLEEKGFQVNHL